jgi:alkylation response protein AidB-like acyl-CoA dehydrogenase
MLSMFNFEQVMLGGAGLGVARSAFEIARRHARARVAFGCKQLIWDKVARMSWRIEAAELLTYRAAKLYDAGPADHLPGIDTRALPGAMGAGRGGARASPAASAGAHAGAVGGKLQLARGGAGLGRRARGARGQASIVRAGGDVDPHQAGG